MALQNNWLPDDAVRNCCTLVICYYYLKKFGEFCSVNIGLFSFESSQHTKFAKTSKWFNNCM